MKLNKKDSEVLILIRKGMVGKEIAEELGIDRYTVEQHIKFLCQRFHVSRSHLELLKEDI